MKRILLMVFRNIFKVPGLYSKLCKYAKTVGTYAFARTAKLEIVDLHTVTSLGDMAFDTNFQTTALKYIVIRSETAATIGTAFDLSPRYDLLVPRALIATYEELRYDERGEANTSITVLALEDYTVDGTITGELDLTKMGL